MISILAEVSPEGLSPWQALLDWARIDSAWQLALVSFGVLAQLMFFCRWIVQWIATERRGESHVPELFWWMSLVGAALLFVYFLLRQEPVGMLGQSVGWVVYTRNLHHVRRKRQRDREHAESERCRENESTSSG